MTPLEILKEKAEVAIGDVLLSAIYDNFVSEFSSEQYPHFFDNQKNINGWYRKGLSIIYDSIQTNQISAFGRLFSKSNNDYASIKNIHKLIERNKLETTNQETKKCFDLMRDLEVENSEIIKKIVNTRNNLVAHSFNEQMFVDRGGGSRPSENKIVVNQLLKWSIRLSTLLMSLDLDSKWNHMTISHYVYETIPSLNSVTVGHLLAFNEPTEGDKWTVQKELIPLD